MEEINISFFHAALRIAPSVAFVTIPELALPFAFRALMGIAFTLIVASQIPATALWPGDLLFGVIFAILSAFFLQTSVKAAAYFVHRESEESDSPLQTVLQSLWCLFLLMTFVIMKFDHTLLEIFAVDLSTKSQFAQPDKIFTFLKLLTVFSLKLSCFGFSIALSKSLLEEIYWRLGGETLRWLFSCLFWVVFILLAPLIVPSLGHSLEDMVQTNTHKILEMFFL